MKTVIILGSARKNGNTREVVTELIKISDWDLVDLFDYNIAQFDYEHQNRSDDFIPLLERITSDYETFIFATPVYWYSMSGILKVFFDRLTDLLRIEKELGRKLRGKNMAVITSSNGDNLGTEFWLPFKKSAEYLGMHYITNLHTYQDNIDLMKIEEFVAAVDEGKKIQ